MVQDRLENILGILKCQRGSACDVHSIGNMQHTAVLTLELLKTNCISERQAEEITIRLEAKLVAFIRKKYVRT